MGYERLMNAWADVRRRGVRVVESPARLRVFADRLDMLVLLSQVAHQSHLSFRPSGPGHVPAVVVIAKTAVRGPGIAGVLLR